MKKFFLPMLFTMLLAACGSSTTPTSAVTATQFSTLTPAPTNTPTRPAPTSTPAPIGVFASEALPEVVRTQLTDKLAQHASTFIASGDPNLATLQVAYVPNVDVPVIGQWVYALVAPFPTLVDDVPFAAVQAAWQGQIVSCDACDFTGPLRMSESTLSAFKAVLGEPAASAVEVLPADQITAKLWEAKPAWGIVPFEELNPRLKVLSIDGRTPIHHGLDLNAYPLSVKLGLAGPIEQAEQLQAAVGQSLTNRDESKMTLVVMTGVTAMSRRFATAMEEHGVLYPAEKIKGWFDTSDIVHISNEVSFSQGCRPMPTGTAVFCSDPKYWDLLKYIGTDVIELTGNHLNDYGSKPLKYTLDLYDREGIPYFGGGRTITEATRFITLTNNGNVIAFVGCDDFDHAGSPAVVDGPGDGRAGAAPCDPPYPEMQQEISRALASGAVVFTTLQYYELNNSGEYSYEATPSQRRDFGSVADAGAAVVSGSQGHNIQGFGFRGNAFIHYGLGNLFFDQTQSPGLQQNMIDRYLIYDNKLLGVELLATFRDDSQQPRPMTPQEKRDLLKTLFSVSYWQ